MNLAQHITDLLYRYDCVIVPNFGGFVTHKIGAKIQNNTFYAPAKQIAFNSHLKHNDGLLANYIASVENSSFETASENILLTVNNWTKELQTGVLEITNLGTLCLNKERQIIFEPTTTTNYLTASFGLYSIETSSIKRNKEHVKPLVAVATNKKTAGVPLFIKYAATAAILLTLSAVGYTGYQHKTAKTAVLNQQKNLEKKIQSATFVISNPLPTLELAIVKEKLKPYHIVAGAFQFAENAEKKVNELKEKGFDATIIGINKWGLTQVTFNSYSNKNEAINSLNKIKRTVSKDAWLLVEK